MKKPYTQKNEVINKKTIHKFKRPNWHRDFREQHIKNIMRGLTLNTHFSEPITVNTSNGDYTIINGNHRIEAIRRILKKDASFSIEATITKYSVSKEKEIAIYETINNAKSETSLDKIKARTIRSLFVSELSSFPVRVLFRGRTTETNAVPITVLVSPYMSRNNKQFIGGQMSDFINAMDLRDIANVKNFLRFYRSVFGDFSNDNLYAKTVIVCAFAKIYYNNIDITLSKNDLIKRCEVLKNRYTARLVQLSNTREYGAQVAIYELMLEALSSRKKLFNILNVEVKNDKKEMR